MKAFCRRVKVLIKSGIDRIVALCKENRKTIIRYAGKLVIYVCKTIIEFFLEGRF